MRLPWIKWASEHSMTERAMQRVLTYGFDRQTLDVLLYRAISF